MTTAGRRIRGAIAQGLAELVRHLERGLQAVSEQLRCGHATT
jgi:hypothetical protein